MFSWGMPSAETVYIGMRLTTELEETSINGHPINLCHSTNGFGRGLAPTCHHRSQMTDSSFSRVNLRTPSAMQHSDQFLLLALGGASQRLSQHSIRLNGFGEAYLMNLI